NNTIKKKQVKVNTSSNDTEKENTDVKEVTIINNDIIKQEKITMREHKTTKLKKDITKLDVCESEKVIKHYDEIEQEKDMDEEGIMFTKDDEKQKTIKTNKEEEISEDGTWETRNLKKESHQETG
ncbi:hypothetical protein L9F63_020809, partial [Diploptera punctata]